jgi:hypothetical protein
MIALAKGKYIARMDADDISLPKRIEKQIAVLETHTEYVMCGTNAYVINEKGKRVKRPKRPLSNEEINIAKYYMCPFRHPTVVVRKEVIQTIKYNEEFDVAQDYELWFRILSQYKAINLKEYLLEYRTYPESVSGNLRKKQREMDIRTLAVNLTGNNIALAEKFYYNFRNTNVDKILIDNELEVLLINQLHKIDNAKGYNFYILMRYFKYFFYRKQLSLFFKSLSINENIRFLTRLLGKRYLYIQLFKLLTRKK